MLEQIQQNPLASIVILLVPCIGVAWKVFDILYVKPRDFRIAVLERSMDELRKELQRPSGIPTQAANRPINEGAPSNAQSEREKMPTRKIEDVIEGTTLLNDVSAFFEAWKNKSLTELQRDQFEKNYLGQKVVWRTRLGDVNEERDSLLWVSLTSPNDDNYWISVIAVFEPKFKEALLMVKKGEIVTVSGIIERFSLSPVLRNCNLVRSV